MPTRPRTFGYETRQLRPTAAQRGPYNDKRWYAARRRVAIRDLFTCQECKATVGIRKGDYHCDHIKERPVGAPWSPETWDNDSNLRTLCPSCHNKRSGGRR